MNSSKLTGNQAAAQIITRMLSNQAVPHALLFHGQNGVGKSILAKEVAEGLMGSSHIEKIRKQIHPDLILLYPEGRSGMYSIEQVRSLVQMVSLPPFEAKVKIFIIHEADKLSAICSNALLKTLEEANSDTYFILLTDEIEKLLETVTSRCYKVRFFPIPSDLIVSFLQEHTTLTKEEARNIADRSQGSLAKAKWLQEIQSEKLQRFLTELFSLNLPQDYSPFIQIMAGVDTLLEDINAEMILEEILEWYRDLHAFKHQASEFYHSNHMQLLVKKSEEPLPTLEKILEAFIQAQTALQRNIKLSIAIENMLLQLAEI
ncbi:ATP-binding protein [Candidatus Rhabdochlamydia porcellionis]|jgi:DNA polymerase III subunit delta'|uniref:DNA polymerase III n=1 Tax=Candidatus Rhabdochlamydia porcellionis TaxID=225148 RepID=A0ABX8YZC0_9BACT|nr:AAA family ATPase [Candidatus Rhabdochlamydia porcellionis]QZA58719.1 DNA polymerase III [Candidatus Rhabdochlamydia porcellionis]